MALSLQEKRQALEQKKKALELKLKALAVQDRAQERKRNDRKKFLIGAYYLERSEKNPTEMEQIIRALDTWLVRDRDRELFGLPLRVGGAAAPAVPRHRADDAKKDTPKDAPKDADKNDTKKTATFVIRPDTEDL